MWHQSPKVSKVSLDASAAIQVVGAGLCLGLGLYAFCSPDSKVGFFVRFFVAFIGLASSMSFGALLAVPLRLVGQEQMGVFLSGRAYRVFMSTILGITVDIQDPSRHLQTLKSAVIIANHQSELDTLLSGSFIPPNCCVTAKKSFRRWPLPGWFFALTGTIFLDKDNTSGAKAAMRNEAKKMKGQSRSVLIFPEGTRSYSQEPMLLPFRKGAFHFAIQAGLPILPVVIANYGDIASPKTFNLKSGRIPCKGTSRRLPTLSL